MTATGIPAGSIDLSGGKSSAFTIHDGIITTPATPAKAVTVSSTSLDKDGNAIGESATQAKVAEAIQVQLDTGGIKATVSFVDDKLQVKSNAVGTGAAAPTLTATSDTAGLGLGTTTTARPPPPRAEAPPPPASRPPAQRRRTARPRPPSSAPSRP